MKLTEKQLANLFKQNNNSSINADAGCLLDSSDASDKRINDVEKIANNSQLSASYQVINQLKNWSKDVSHDLDLSNKKSSFSNVVLNWLKPSLATAAIATTVYFMVPIINQETTVTPVIQAQTDSSMFSGDFEISTNNPVKIKASSKPDVIYNGSFG